MAMRNFYLTADIDGRDTPLTGGPAGKDGGFSLTVKVRDNGTSKDALHVRGYVNRDGGLVITANIDSNYWVPGDGDIRIESER